MTVQITYDASADAAYILFQANLERGEVVRTEPCDVDIKEGAVILEFDGKGRLAGIEILGASRILPAETLDEAMRF
ncbi:DUF2283 domain-containing protein [Thioalkalivibrio sp. XN279]|uniref:DUF2283 domain-containing protein n=1 Tax=Thioalkalivibrio sp. XN279 TaxID=2714953 RepID=UPI00140BC489|nr:DUF2283 domain-containing protein [Thioalkalivibrio sp. XN279]NHA16186.1 DUF2283 domain-containing protein [Thioalkalivibrio sp. XN279]